jgi:hypothetical protein
MHTYTHPRIFVHTYTHLRTYIYTAFGLHTLSCCFPKMKPHCQINFRPQVAGVVCTTQTPVDIDLLRKADLLEIR